jgi:hypothetical protein
MISSHLSGCDRATSATILWWWWSLNNDENMQILIWDNIYIYIYIGNMIFDWQWDQYMNVENHSSQNVEDSSHHRHHYSIELIGLIKLSFHALEYCVVFWTILEARVVCLATTLHDLSYF